MALCNPNEQAVIATVARSVNSHRDAHVQTLRGIACLLIVAYHVAGTDGTRGIQIEPNHPLAIINLLLSPIRLPLFTFISGYVYAMRPVEFGHERQFLRGKARRLLVPLITVSFLYFLIQFLVPQTHYYLQLKDGWRIFVFPYQHLWYLQALALIFVVMVLLERCGQLDDPRNWLLTLAVSVLLYLTVNFPLDVFAINEALFLLPFFTLGVGICRFPWIPKIRNLGAASAIVAVLGLTAYSVMLMDATPLTDLDRDALWVIIGMPTCIALFSFDIENDLLARLGGFSYAIYLFHILGTAGARTALLKLGGHSTNVLLIVAFLSGLSLPILIQLLADQSRIAAFLLLGRDPNRPEPRLAAPVRAFGH